MFSITTIGLPVRHVGTSTDAKRTGAAPDFTSVGFGISDSNFSFRFYNCTGIYLYIYIYIYIRDVPGGMYQTSGGCSLC